MSSHMTRCRKFLTTIQKPQPIPLELRYKQFSKSSLMERNTIHAIVFFLQLAAPLGKVNKNLHCSTDLNHCISGSTLYLGLFRHEFARDEGFNLESGFLLLFRFLQARIRQHSKAQKLQYEILLGTSFGHLLVPRSVSCKPK